MKIQYTYVILLLRINTNKIPSVEKHKKYNKKLQKSYILAGKAVFVKNS